MKRWWMPGLLLVSYGAAFAVNVGYFAWSYPVGWPQVTTSALYGAVWIGCLIFGRGSRRLMRLTMIMGAAMAAGSLLGLLVRTLGSAGLTLPALILSGLTVTPLYGLLSLIGDYDLFYLAAAALGAGVCALAKLFRCKINAREEKRI